MQVRWSGGIDSLSALASWPRERTDSLFEGRAWYEHFTATAIADDVRPTWLWIDGDSAAAGQAMAFPLQLSRERIKRVPVTVLSSLSNFYSMRWSPLMRTGRADPELYAVAARSLLARGAAVLRFAPIDPDAAWLVPLGAALEAAGATVEREVAFANWRVDVSAGDFERYFGARPARVRNTWQRKRKAMAREGQVTFVLHDGQGSVEAAIAQYQHVYQRSWKPTEGFAEFVPGLIRHAAQRSALRLGVLQFDCTPIAAQIWLLDGSETIIYKLAHDRQFDRFSPGLQLIVEMMRVAIERDRVAIIDFGSGDDQYKQDWMEQRREMVRLCAWNHRTVAGFIGAATRKMTQSGRADRGRPLSNPGK